MISSRYGFAVITLFGIALIPTLIHTYGEIRSDDGRSASKISSSLSGLQSEPTSRTAKWVKKTFQSNNWIERHYGKPGDEPLLLFVGRSYDPKRLYHHPELVLVYGKDLGALDAIRLPQMVGIPIHLLKEKATGGHGLAVYALLYDDQFVDNPYLFQLKNAWRLLLKPRKPMTLFFVYDPVSAPDYPIGERRAVRLLHDAIKDFLSQPAKV